jgi:ankyrin repeat protein
MSDVLLDLCQKATAFCGKNESLTALEQWLNDNKDNLDLLQEAANFRHENNRSPLHYLVQVSLLHHLVKQLLKLAPDKISLQSDHGDLPLHIACKTGPCTDFIMLLLEYSPHPVDLLVHPDTGHSLPHCFQCKPHPKVVDVHNKDGDSLLHIACNAKASPIIIMTILESYTKATKTK